MLLKTKIKHERRQRRHRRIRGQVFGTAERPRLSVYRSNRHLYAVLIDDDSGTTFVDSRDMIFDGSGTPKEKAEKIGEDIAKKAKVKKLGKVVFDRGGFIYAGRIKALADAARKAGLKF
jgi:large subunit ribosomal protein L18